MEIFCLVVGILIVVFGCGMLIYVSKLKRDGKQTTAVVVAMLGQDNKALIPLLQVDNNGTSVEVAYQYTSNPPRYKAGDKLQVFYNHDKQRVLIVGDNTPTRFGIGLVVCGCIAIAFAIVIMCI